MGFFTRIKETGWFYDGNRNTLKTNEDIKSNPKKCFYGNLEKLYPHNLNSHILT